MVLTVNVALQRLCVVLGMVQPPSFHSNCDKITPRPCLPPQHDRSDGISGCHRPTGTCHRPIRDAGQRAPWRTRRQSASRECHCQHQDEAWRYRSRTRSQVLARQLIVGAVRSRLLRIGEVLCKDRSLALERPGTFPVSLREPVRRHYGGRQPSQDTAGFQTACSP